LKPYKHAAIKDTLASPFAVYTVELEPLFEDKSLRQALFRVDGAKRFDVPGICFEDHEGKTVPSKYVKLFKPIIISPQVRFSFACIGCACRVLLHGRIRQEVRC
jgi:hypothetical protein